MFINGKAVAEEIYEEIREDIRGKRICFVSFKKSPESQSFMRKKSEMAEKLGVETEIREVEAGSTDEAIRQVKEICEERFDGIVVQLPLPDNFDGQKVFDAVPRELDIDVLSSESKEAFRARETKRLPPVAGAVQAIFDRYSVNPRGQKVVILGKGRLVGEPVAAMLENQKIEFLNFDIRDKQAVVENALRDADVIITGIGSPSYIKPEMIKSGCVIIDAGTSESEGKLAGDADPACAEKARYQTPVPGGVGPITIASLLKNLCYLC